MQLREFHTSDETGVRGLLTDLRWTDAQIEGQVDAIRALAASESGFVSVATDGDRLQGFTSAQFYAWNRLAQIHGLVVAPDQRRQGIAGRLLKAAEEFACARRARGIYVDTPVDNDAARAFYVASGYEEAYRMPRYYSDDLDGVTFTKFFD